MLFIEGERREKETVKMWKESINQWVCVIECANENRVLEREKKIHSLQTQGLNVQINKQSID